MGVEARLLGPGDQLLCGKTLVALLDGGMDEEVLSGGTNEAVDHVDGRGKRATVLLAHAVERRDGTVVGAGDAA